MEYGIGDNSTTSHSTFSDYLRRRHHQKLESVDGIVCIGGANPPKLSIKLAQMAVGDKLLGLILLLAAGFIFVYYTIWVLILVSNRK